MLRANAGLFVGIAWTERRLLDNAKMRIMYIMLNKVLRGWPVDATNPGCRQCPESPAAVCSRPDGDMNGFLIRPSTLYRRFRNSACRCRRAERFSCGAGPAATLPELGVLDLQVDETD